MLKGRFSSSALPGSTEAEAAKKEAKDSNDDIAHVMGGGDLTTSAGGLLTMDATVRKKKSIVFTNDSDKGKSLKGNNHRRSVAVTNSGSSGMNSSVGSDDKKKLKKRASLSLNKNVPTESGGHGIRLAALVQANTGKDGNSGDDDEENLNFRNTDDDRYTDRPTHLNTSRGRTSGLNDTGPRLKSVRSLSSVTQAMIAKSEAQGLSEKQFAMRVNKVRSLIQKHHSLANYGFFSDNNLCSSYNFKTLKSGPSDSNKRPQQEEGMEDGDRNKEDDPLKSTFENIWQDYFARYDDDVRIFDTKLESCDKEVAEATDTLSRFVDRLDVFQSDDKSREDRAVTNFLKKQNGDIEKTLEQIDDVLEIFACPSKCDAKIREGPTGNAIDYFTTIDKLIEARQFLEDHPNYVNSSETIMQIVKIYTHTLSMLVCNIDQNNLLFTLRTNFKVLQKTCVKSTFQAS